MRIAPTFRVAFHGSRMTARNQEALLRIIDSADTPVPEVQLLSNGRYHVLVTRAGGGSSRWRNLPITRWCEDATSAGSL